MAKKSYQIVKEVYDLTIQQDGPDTSVIKAIGVNKKGTPCEVRITVDEWRFPHMIHEMAMISRQRLQAANDQNDRVIKAVQL